MADKIDRDTAGGEPGFFKREDGKDAGEISSHLPHTPGTPSPHLGRHQVDDRNAEGLQLAGDPQVEVRTVGKDR